jgi:glycine/D-amino acid oxidase-like deaminating enzyme
LDSVAFTQPRRCVVIGAGVLGASLAARLASSGVHVTLLDQDQPDRATSRWSFAWLNSNDKSPRPYHDLNHAGSGPGPNLRRISTAPPGTAPSATWNWLPRPPPAPN